MKKVLVTAIFSTLCLLVLSVMSPGLSFGAPDFKGLFIDNYKQGLFAQQADLVKRNKDKISPAVKELMSDAASAEHDAQKLEILDIANAMATMYMHWHNDGTILKEVEAAQKEVMKRERERLAEVEKWSKYEKFLGNIVMKKKGAEMEKAGQSPVVFPHWLHRTWFECRACHEGVFEKKKDANVMSHALMSTGAYCGACHNGTLAFKSEEKENCAKCHSVGKTEADALYDIKKIDNAKVASVAKSLGGQWNHELLTNGKLPVDKFGYIDWLELKRKGVLKPVPSIPGRGSAKTTHDSKILFEPTMQTVNNVLFDHVIHTDWIDCVTCHKSNFVPELGANKVSMREMSEGKFCGSCHGKVSYPFATCNRCHSQPKDAEPKAGVLKRHAK